VARDLRVRRVLAQGAQEQRRHPQQHVYLPWSRIQATGAADRPARDLPPGRLVVAHARDDPLPPARLVIAELTNARTGRATMQDD
jgi:hypothetical protein